MISPKSSATLVAYVPAPHAGYLKLFRKYAGGTLWVLSEDLIDEFKSLKRNLPAPAPQEVATMVRSLKIFDHVCVLTRDQLPYVSDLVVVMPDEDVSRALAQKYFASSKVTFEPIWLRWDWGSSQKNVRPPERVISTSGLDRELMRLAQAEAERSSDWWRNVAALLVKDGIVLVKAFNKHMPSEQTPYLVGDPRSNAEQGIAIEVSNASHAERRVQAIAAREGISTKGCDLYVTVFPCQPCALSWTESGIRRLYYRDGYTNLEGGNALETHGIEIVRVEMNTPPT